MSIKAEDLLGVIERKWSAPTGVIDAVAKISRKFKKLRKTLNKWEKQSFGNITQ